MATIDNDYQTSLLFKQWTGVATLRLDQPFSSEPNKSIQNIYSKDIFVEDIPESAPISIATLDTSGAWLDSSSVIFSPSKFNNGVPSHPWNNKSFSEIFPDSNLEFYKNFSLIPAAFVSQGRVWGAFTDAPVNKESFFEDTIPFKYDDELSTYLMVVKHNTGTSASPIWSSITINDSPLYWLLDAQAGYLQFYASTIICEANNIKDILNNGVQDINKAPTISCFKYIGKKGLLNLDISGQQQVIDISGLGTDISGIEINLQKVNRMILPDGFVDISGTDYDLCGNEVVRTYYTYNRNKMFLGYDNLPILDGSAVNHSEDPSFNNINNIDLTLDISGNTYISGSLIQGFFDPSLNNITSYQGVSGEYSHAEGYRTWVGGDYSHAEGDSNKIYCLFSHAEGRENTIEASSNCSHAEGWNNTIQGGLYNHIEGVSNLMTSNSIGAHIEGTGNQILRDSFSSHAEGAFTIVGSSGAYSHAEGYHTIIDTSGGHATGHWNDMSKNVIFVVGCGDSSTNRMDAIYVDISCVTHINNQLEISGNTLIDGILDMSCNKIIDISNINFCNNTAILGDAADILTISGDLDMSMNQIVTIADATDNSGVPSWGQVQQAINDLSGSITSSYWTQNGTDFDLYYNTGNVGIGTITPSQTLEVSGNTLIDGILDMGCNNVIDVSNIYLCNNTALLSNSAGILTISGDLDMSMNKIITIADASDNSDVPSWGQVQAAIGGGGGVWSLAGNDIYNNNSGNVGIGTTTPQHTLDISGSCDVRGNLLEATSTGNDFTVSGVTDYNPYFRQTNIIDTMKIPFISYFNDFWKPMVERCNNILFPGFGYWGQGLASPFGPNLIPIAKINTNDSYYPGNVPATTEPSLRPLLANTIGYFTIKFSQPSMDTWSENLVTPDFSPSGTWKEALGLNPVGSKPGYNCVPEQTIHFMAGYQEQEYNLTGEDRNPKPFIKILSCSIGDIRNVNGETVIYKNTPVLDLAGIYQGKKIGGITRIIIAEGTLKFPPQGIKGNPLPDEETTNKAWLLLEQTWAYESWMTIPYLQEQEKVLEKICGDHNIEVRLYSNNTGAKMFSRDNNPTEMAVANNVNTDWQLLSNDLLKPFIIKWLVPEQPSLLLSGLPDTSFNPPFDVNGAQAIQTLFVGGQNNGGLNNGGLNIGIGETATNQLWFVDLNIYNWPYGITTTKEIFKFDVDIYGTLTANSTYFGSSIFENITVNNQATIGTGGAIILGPTEANFSGIINSGSLDNGGNTILCGNVYVGNGGANGSNMSTQVIPRTNSPIILNISHAQNSFEYYKLATINAESSPLEINSPSGFFELNYYITGPNYNGSGKSATMQTVRFIVGSTVRDIGSVFCDNVYIDILSNQYQGPNSSDIKIKDLIITVNSSNEIILYGLLHKPTNAAGTSRYTMRLYQGSSDIDAPHDANTNWTFIYGTNAYIGTGPLPIDIARYTIELDKNALDLYSGATPPLDGMKMRYADTSGNKLINANFIITRPAFFEQYVKFNKGIDISNTKIINVRGILGKNQSVIGNNVGTTPSTDDMYIETLGTDSDLYLKVRKGKSIRFTGQDQNSPGTNITSINMNMTTGTYIDMDFQNINNIINVNLLTATDITCTNLNVANIIGDISMNNNDIYVDQIIAREVYGTENVSGLEIRAGKPLPSYIQNYISLKTSDLSNCIIAARGPVNTNNNLRIKPWDDGYLTIESNNLAQTLIDPSNIAWNFSNNRYPSASVFVEDQENTILFNSNAFIIGPGTTTTGDITNSSNVTMTVGGTTLAQNIVMSLSCPENGISTSAGGSSGASGSYLSNFLAIGGSGGGTSNYQGFETSYPGSSFQQPGETASSVWYSAASMGKTHGYYLRSQLSKPSGQPPSSNPGVGKTLGWLEFDLFCGDATFGAPGQGNGGPGLTASIIHSEPYAQEIGPLPAPIAGSSGADVVRPNLSIGAVPRNFYGPSTIGIIPVPPGTTSNMAISPYDPSTGILTTSNKVWTISIGGNADSYINLPTNAPGNASGSAGNYIGGGSSSGSNFYYPNPGVNLVLNGISFPHNGESFGGKTYINGEIINSNYIAGNYFPIRINTHASDLILAPDNGGNVVIEPNNNSGTGVLPGAVKIFLGGDPLGSGASGGGLGYIKCQRASNPSGGATGPTNICNANHNGYIGTQALTPSNGTGLRGYSCLATTFAAAAKLYIAKNNAPAADNSYMCCSAIESTQGIVVMRGQVRLTGSDAIINLDTAVVGGFGEIYIPHTYPNKLVEGTFNAMYQNPTVQVNNAGILGGSYPNLDFDPAFTQLQGIIKTVAASNTQTLLIIQSNNATPDIFVNWCVYCERKDNGYQASPFVSNYTNPVTNVTSPTWNSVGWNSVGDASGNMGGANLNEIFGENNYVFD